MAAPWIVVDVIEDVVDPLLSRRSRMAVPDPGFDFVECQLAIRVRVLGGYWLM